MQHPQSQRSERPAEPTKRGKARKKSNSNSEAYYPQYLAERHFPSSQDPLQVTVQVELDGKRQSESYPATLTIKHCFDNYFSYFLDLPRDLRARIRKAGEIKGWTQVDELTIKISLSSKPSTQDATTEQSGPGNPHHPGLSPSAFAAAVGASNNAASQAAALGWPPTNSNASSQTQRPPRPSPASVPSSRADVYSAAALDPSLKHPFATNPAPSSRGPEAPTTSALANLLNAQQYLPDATVAQLDRLLRPHLAQLKTQARTPFPGLGPYKPPPPFTTTNFDQSSLNALLLANQLPPSSSPPSHLPALSPSSTAAAYDEQAAKRLRYSEGMPPPAAPISLPPIAAMAMRSLTGGPALHLQQPSVTDDDTIDGASWDRYMTTMLDTADKIWPSGTGPDSPLDASALPRSSLLSQLGALDAARASASASDLLRSDSGVLAALRSPRLPDIAPLQTGLPLAGPLDFSGSQQQQQQLSPSHSQEGRPNEQLSAAQSAILASMQAAQGQGQGGTAGLSRRNSFSPTELSGAPCDVSTMVAELLHMVGYLKPSFEERLLLLVALQKTDMAELAGVHAAMKGAWDQKSIAKAHQIFAQLMEARRLPQPRLEGLTATPPESAALAFPALMPGMQGAANLAEGAADVLTFLQADSKLQEEVMQVLQATGELQRQVINTGLVDACVRRSLEDLKGVVYSIVNI